MTSNPRAPSTTLDASPLDGLRPRAAVCLRCGYQFNGIPISAGAITCPECGHRSHFDPPAPKPSGRSLRGAFIRLALLIGLIFALGLLFVLAR